jgi:diaminopimelate decarboxylase
VFPANFAFLQNFFLKRADSPGQSKKATMQEKAILPYLSNAPSDFLVLVEKYGAPLYVYDAEIIQRQYERLKNAFQVPRLEINYACKALTNLSILKFMRRLGAGLDTVSIQEVHLGLEAGFLPAQITFTPNCVAVEEIEEAWRLGAQINIDSIPALEHFAQLHPEAPVCIRINPHIMAGGNLKTSVGHIDSKFGISVHQMPHVHRIVQATGIRVNGLHMHTGSDILNAEAFLEGAEILLTCAQDFPALDYLDFGSGFKVPYKPGDIETDIEDLGKKLSRRFLAFCKSYGKDLTLVFEPGKFLVSEAGSLLVKVNVVKNTTSTVFAGVDSGMNHLIRPMFYNAYHHISNLSNPNGTPRFYSVVGYICETDTFGVNRKIPEVREGDILCIHNAGAYAFSMSSNYNSRFRPAEVALYKGVDTLIRQRETMADILNNQTGAEL